jgi:hypothetical protein
MWLQLRLQRSVFLHRNEGDSGRVATTGHAALRLARLARDLAGSTVRTGQLNVKMKSETMIVKRLTSAALAAIMAFGSVAPAAAVACEGGGEEKGRSGVIEFNPASEDFGEVTLHNSKTMSGELVARLGEEEIKELYLAPSNKQFSLNNKTCKNIILKFSSSKEKCLFEVTFTPELIGESSAPVEALGPSGKFITSLWLKGIGKNEVNTVPTNLEWASGETGKKPLKLKTLATIKVEKIEIKDPTAFKAFPHVGCKETESFSTTCEVDIERLTSAKSFAIFRWTYKEGSSTVEGKPAELKGN